MRTSLLVALLVLASASVHAQEPAPAPISEPVPTRASPLPATDAGRSKPEAVDTVPAGASQADPEPSFGPKGFNVQSADGWFAFSIRFPFMFDAKATPDDDQRSSGDAFHPRFFGPILSTTIDKAVSGGVNWVPTDTVR